jgi:hypothetical protein
MVSLRSVIQGAMRDKNESPLLHIDPFAGVAAKKDNAIDL